MVRVVNDIFTKRLWRFVKCEEVYLNDYASLREACLGLSRCFHFSNFERPYQALNYLTLAAIYAGTDQTMLYST